MKLRQARKIAKVVDQCPITFLPYSEQQLFNAYTRLHTEWLNRLVVTPRDDGEPWLSVTQDYRLSQIVWSAMIRLKYFPRHGRIRYYRPVARENTTLHSWVRRTWVTRCRKSTG